MGEPISTAIKGAAQVYKTCKVLHQKWKDAENLGRDVLIARSQIDTQYYRLLEIGERKDDQLDHPVRLDNGYNQRTQTVVGLLSGIEGIFRDCDELIIYLQTEYKSKKLQKKRPVAQASVRRSEDDDGDSAVAVGHAPRKLHKNPPPRLNIQAADEVGRSTSSLGAASNSAETRPSNDFGVIFDTPSLRLQTSYSPSPENQSPSELSTRGSIAPKSPKTSTRDHSPTTAWSSISEVDSISKGKKKEDKKKNRFSMLALPKIRLGRSKPSKEKPAAAAPAKPQPTSIPLITAPIGSSSDTLGTQLVQKDPAALPSEAASGQDEPSVSPARSKADDIESLIKAERESSTVEIEDPEKVRQRVQAQARVEQHVTYARKKRELEDNIHRLRELVDDLDMATTLRKNASTVQTTKSAQKAAQLSGLVRSTQDALDRLHRTLRASNVAKWGFSLQLAEDFMEESLAFFDTYEHHFSLHNRGKNLYFFVYRYLENRMKPSNLFAIQSSLGSHSAQLKIHPNQSANNLEQAKRFVGTPPKPSFQFQPWGGISLSDELGQHWLYHDHRQQWTFTGSLADSIREGSPARLLTVSQRVQLAILILYSHIYLSQAQESCRPVTLASYTYYAEDGPARPWDAAHPQLLSPCIDFGFGEPVNVRFGGHRAAAVDRSHGMALMGVSLAQVALCTLHEFDAASPDAVRGARRWALGQLGRIDAQVGVQFSEVVSDCVKFALEALPGLQAENARRQNEFLVDQIARLQQMKTELRSSEAGAAVPDPSRLVPAGQRRGGIIS